MSELLIVGFWSRGRKILWSVLSDTEVVEKSFRRFGRIFLTLTWSKNPYPVRATQTLSSSDPSALHTLTKIVGYPPVT